CQHAQAISLRLSARSGLRPPLSARGFAAVGNQLRKSWRITGFSWVTPAKVGIHCHGRPSTRTDLPDYVQSPANGKLTCAG
ncbi:hypothetical protein AVDCRST_MAG82-2182, partial [uncultured Rubrobacteraceae bacterium]